MDNKEIEELRQKFINNPPEGMSSDDIRSMTDNALLDLDYTINKDDYYNIDISEYESDDYFTF